MASQHRKPRFMGTRAAGNRTPALATAALTSVALLPQSANAVPTNDGGPSLEEVEKKIDDLYRSRKAQSSTEKHNTAREKPGSFTAPQHRTGAPAPAPAALPLADSPQDRQEAAESLASLASLHSLADTQSELKTAKATVQKKLDDARVLLSSQLTVQLTAQEEARPTQPQQNTDAQSPPSPSAPIPISTSADGSADASASTNASVSASTYGAKAEKALALARAQIGKPYVWGATGPESYDCSSLTQAAWKAAGVSLPRTIRDQADAGPTVSLADARPGDLVFFYDDISHVGFYLGNGMMIHAPKPGTYVREESIYYDGESGIHSVVRPA